MQASLPPHNLQAEEACVGSLLIDAAAITTVKDELAPGDFYHQPAGLVYQALLKLEARGVGADLITVADELEKAGDLKHCGGMAYITRLINTVPSALHVLDYAGTVRDMAGRRRLLATLGTAGAAAHTPTTPLGDAADHLRGWLQDYEADTPRTIAHISEVAGELWAQIDEWRNSPLRPGQTRYVSTGFHQLDKLLGGLRAGFYLLAGRPSMGKTAMALSLALNVAGQGVATDYITTEMTPLQLLLRLASSTAGIPAGNIEAGRLSCEQHGRVSDAIGSLASLPLTIITGVADLSRIRAHLNSTEAEVVFLDFLGTVDAPGDNRHLRLGAIARELLLASQRQNLPIIALHHLRRAAENRVESRPTMADLYESGHLECNADVVMLLWREGYYDTAVTHKVMQVNVAKNRLCGKIGVANTTLNEYGLVDDVEQFVPYRRGDGDD